MEKVRHLDPGIARDFGVSNSRFVTTTALATVWQVDRADGQVAALKVYLGGDRRNEAHGTDFLRALDGRGVVQIYEETPEVVLMEWLEGPSLSEAIHHLGDDDAARELGQVAWQIHAEPLRGAGTAFTPLEAWCQPLAEARCVPEASSSLHRSIDWAQRALRELLGTASDQFALHGDLHQGNVRKGARGYTAFDAKGLWGDPAYELANAFRHPLDQPDLVRDLTRIERRLDIWSEAMGVDPKRLITWAAVKCALSMAWRDSGMIGVNAEADLLETLVSIAQRRA